MAKFVYRMQSILNIKYKLENQAKAEYSSAVAALQAERIKLDDINDDINRYKEELRSINSGDIDVLKLRENTDALGYKKREAASQLIVIERAQKKVDRKKEKLNEVMIDRKTHEKLREKAFDEFLKEIAGQEAREIDELVSFQHNNQNTGEK